MHSSGGPRNTPPGTIAQLFFDAVARHDKPDALQYKVDGVYQPISSKVLAERVRRLALAMKDLGIAAGDRVGIISDNRPEWAIADYACVTSALPDVPLYPNLPAEQAAYILRDSGAVAIFVGDEAQGAKIASVRASCPSLKWIITFAAAPHAGADHTLAELEARGAALDDQHHRAEYMSRARAVKPDDILTLIYTSGTTGDPKGVMLTHDNLFSNVMASAVQIPFSATDVGLSFLPLSHIFERMGGHYLMLHTGCSIAYATSIETVPADLQAVRPTLVQSVPRLYEKMYARVLENALSGGALKQHIFFWARRVAEEWADVRLAGGEPAGLLALKYSVAQKLVFSKLQARTGGRLRYFVSGGAPLATEINKFFYAAGLMILEGYGLTETSPVIAVNSPTAFRLGTVGKIVSGVEVSIASDGEILTRGPHVMKGYYNKPEATAEAIDSDGWFHTGDIGELRDGYLAITDRKKDIIVTAGGKNIAPQPIENAVKTNKFVSQAVIIGDKRKFPIALVVPDWDQLERFAKAEQIVAPSRAALLQLPAIREKMDAEVRSQLTGLAKFEMPKKIALLEHDFSIERGELTPTLKVKRRVIDKTYKSVIDELYATEHDGVAI